MSFILDALRKSEHERQRADTPGISQVPLAAPRQRVPRWMVALIAVLSIAVVLLAGAWWRSLQSGPATAAADSTPAAGTTIPLALPPGPRERPRTGPAETAGARPLASLVEPEAAAPPPAPVPRAATSTNPAPPSAAATLPSAAALAAEGIPVPPLRLELHAYADRPADRFVFINGTRYREGQTLAEGPELIAIEPNGVVLSQQGRRFLLGPE
jgi:general secretion pathway protein B